MIEMHSNKQKKKKNYLMFVTEVEEGLIEMGFPYRKIKQAQSGLTKKQNNHGWWIIGLKRCSVMNLGWSRR